MLVLSLLASAAPKQFTLVIDAGHGGHDAGAIGAFSKEKDINLRTALAFGRYVETNCPDVRVIYTRKTDVFVTLGGRADIANKAKADLFISIHTNSLPKGHVGRGLETYTLGMHRAGENLDVAKRENSVILVEKDYKERYEGFDPNSAESYIIFEFMQDHNMARSVELARLVQSNACRTANRQNKGVKQAGFLVLRETSMPSCLIELGFISTPDEERFLNTQAGIDNIARGIYQAFAAYKNKYSTSGVKSPTAIAAPAAEEPAQQTAQPEPQQPKPADVQQPKQDKPKQESARQSNEATAQSTGTDAPVFKVQICTADHPLKPTDSHLKGHSEAKYYKEGRILKYTLGESTDYNQIYRLRKDILSDFPDAFIIAFRNGEKMNINEAIREFKSKKK